MQRCKGLSLLLGMLGSVSGCNANSPVVHGTLDGSVRRDGGTTEDAGTGDAGAVDRTDPTFGDRGAARVSLGGQGSVGAMDVSAEGKIFLVGSAEAAGDPGHFGFVVARLSSMGAADSTFATGGLYASPTATRTGVDIATKGDDSCVVATATTGGTPMIGLVALTNTGTVDAAFGTAGEVATDLVLPIGVGRPLAKDSAGNLVVAGNQSDHLAVRRYLPNGMPDTSFGAGGLLATTIPMRVRDVLIGTGQVIYVAGNDSSGRSVDVVRITAAGALDATFGSAGRFTTGIGADSNILDAAALALDQSVFLVGSAGSMGATVLKVTPAGVLDASFGTAGRTDIAVPDHAEMNTSTTHLALGVDGRVLVSCRYADTAHNVVGLGFVALSTAGVLDTTPPTGGVHVALDAYLPQMGAIASNTLGVLLAGGTTTDSVGDINGLIVIRVSP